MSTMTLENAVSGALFDFLGFLTGRDEAVTFSASHLATPAVEALREWANKRGLYLDEADVTGWKETLTSREAKGEAVSVDRGALQMALNVLRRAGKNEVAEALEKAAQPAEQPRGEAPITPYRAKCDCVHCQPRPEQATGECPACEPDGVFATDGTGPWDCYVCGKKAKLSPEQAVGDGVADDWNVRDCEECDGVGGSGRLYGGNSWEPTEECSKCRGTGKLARATPRPAVATPEIEGWEQFAHVNNLDMKKHRHHYLFLDEKTGIARQAWLAAIRFTIANHVPDVATPAEVTDEMVLAAAMHVSDDWNDEAEDVKRGLLEIQRGALIAALTAQCQVRKEGVAADEKSEVWVVQDETGQPVFCASWPQACHEHINDAINEHGIVEAKAWKVLHYENHENRSLSSLPRAVGVSREPNRSDALTVYFDRNLSDDDMRTLHDALASPSAGAVVPEGVIGYVHPVMLEGNSLAIEVSRMRLSNVQLPVILAPTQTVAPDESLSDGDMFWTDDCEEYSLPSIDELVEGWVDGGTEDGTVVKVERAKRLPAVLVKVNVSDDSYGYEVLAAAPEVPGHG